MFSGVRPGRIVPGYSSIGSYVLGYIAGEICSMSDACNSGCVDGSISSSSITSERTYPDPGGANIYNFDDLCDIICCDDDLILFVQEQVLQFFLFILLEFVVKPST